VSAAWCVSRESSGPARVPFPGSVHAAWWATSQPMWHPYPPHHRVTEVGVEDFRLRQQRQLGPHVATGPRPRHLNRPQPGRSQLIQRPATPSARKPPDPAPAPGDATRRCRRSPHPQQRASPPHRPAPGHGHAGTNERRCNTADNAPVRPVRSANKRTATDPAWALMCKAVQHLQIMLSSDSHNGRQRYSAHLRVGNWSGSLTAEVETGRETIGECHIRPMRTSPSGVWSRRPGQLAGGSRRAARRPRAR